MTLFEIAFSEAMKQAGIEVIVTDFLWGEGKCIINTTVHDEKIRADERKKFAEWLLHHSMLCDSLGQDLNEYTLLSEAEIIDEVLTEYEKEQKNE